MSRGAALFWSLIMIGSAICLAIGLLGCHPAPPVIPPRPDGYVACAGGTRPLAEDVCERRFTADGFACVKCTAGVSGCIVQAYSVYCVRGGCADPLCVLTP